MPARPARGVRTQPLGRPPSETSAFQTTYTGNRKARRIPPRKPHDEERRDGVQAPEAVMTQQDASRTHRIAAPSPDSLAEGHEIQDQEAPGRTRRRPPS